MRLTTNYGWPVAEGADPVKQYPAAVDGPRTDAIDAEIAALSYIRGDVGVTVAAYAAVGGIYTITHNLGVIPTFIHLTPAGGDIGNPLGEVHYTVFDANESILRVQTNSIVDGSVVQDPARRIAFYYTLG